MMTMIFFFFFVSSNLSPLSMAFSLIFLSVLVSFFFYSITKTFFLSSGVIISFSSGMMITFFYCTFLTSYEAKKTPGGFLFLSFLVGVLGAFSFSESEAVLFNSSLVHQTCFLIGGMAVLLLVMVFVNSCMMSPQKSLMSSY